MYQKNQVTRQAAAAHTYSVGRRSRLMKKGHELVRVLVANLPFVSLLPDLSRCSSPSIRNPITNQETGKPLVTPFSFGDVPRTSRSRLTRSAAAGGRRGDVSTRFTGREDGHAPPMNTRNPKAVTSASASWVSWMSDREEKGRGMRSASSEL
ncbi:hypothetical protein EVAR_54009_1 [Eumeta japonica]|uniref:Uncharacterized protein n=1 Tax=Eumeta variegata TaxID=151549 RepID=A0A4C1XWJ7_EUMVA|nr:hypothetical protein EVAR_54009_1 [Eumeta japonica]